MAAQADKDDINLLDQHNEVAGAGHPDSYEDDAALQRTSISSTTGTNKAGHRDSQTYNQIPEDDGEMDDNEDDNDQLPNKIAGDGPEGSESKQPQKKKFKITNEAMWVGIILCIALVGSAIMLVIIFWPETKSDMPGGTPIVLPSSTSSPFPFSSTSESSGSEEFSSSTFTPINSSELFSSTSSITTPTTSPTTSTPTSSPSTTTSTSTSTSTSSPSSASPTKGPSLSPSTATPTLSPVSPTTNPTTNPTTASPTIPPTKDPTTPAPTELQFWWIMITGTTVNNTGIIEVEFPPYSFPNRTKLYIWNDIQNDTDVQLTFTETTVLHRAIDASNISGTHLHFTVDKFPLTINDIDSNMTYQTIINIPPKMRDLCPENYGYEIFVEIEQSGSAEEGAYPIMVLLPAIFHADAFTLSTHLLPEMFADGQADLILSCTPGTNQEPKRRRSRAMRRLLQSLDGKNCKAVSIECPVQNDACFILEPFQIGKHYGTDFVVNFQNLTAVANGVIEESKLSTIYGEMIVLRHLDGASTLYAGLSDRSVLVGAAVESGDIIGVSGDSYLHFEYVPNGELFNTKGRINPAACILPTPDTFAPTNSPTKDPTPPTTPFPTVPTLSPVTRAPNSAPLPTLIPTLSPVPTIATTDEPTTSTTEVLQGASITIRDSGSAADDSFGLYINDLYLCETEIGELNVCVVNNLRCGGHVMKLQTLIAPDSIGTYSVMLSNGWTFVDDDGDFDAYEKTGRMHITRDEEGNAIDDTDIEVWNFDVPC